MFQNTLILIGSTNLLISFLCIIGVISFSIHSIVLLIIFFKIKSSTTTRTTSSIKKKSKKSSIMMNSQNLKQPMLNNNSPVMNNEQFPPSLVHETSNHFFIDSIENENQQEKEKTNFIKKYSPFTKKEEFLISFKVNLEVEFFILFS